MALRAWMSRPDAEPAPGELEAVHGVDDLLQADPLYLDKSIALRSTCRSVGDNTYYPHLADPAERLCELVFRDGPREIPDIESYRHVQFTSFRRDAYPGIRADCPGRTLTRHVPSTDLPARATVPDGEPQCVRSPRRPAKPIRAPAPQRGIQVADPPREYSRCAAM